MDSELRPLLGMEMEEPAIDDVLTEMGVGVLPMSDEGVPYGVPLSFGDDGDGRLYFVFLGATADLRKETYADQSDVASFTTFPVDPDGAWSAPGRSTGSPRVTGTPPARRCSITRTGRSSSPSANSKRTRPSGRSTSRSARGARSASESPALAALRVRLSPTPSERLGGFRDGDARRLRPTRTRCGSYSTVLRPVTLSISSSYRVNPTLSTASSNSRNGWNHSLIVSSSTLACHSRSGPRTWTLHDSVVDAS